MRQGEAIISCLLLRGTRGRLVWLDLISGKTPGQEIEINCQRDALKINNAFLLIVFVAL